MRIYHYRKESGRYLGSSIAEVDPLDSNNFLIPANATTVAPMTVKVGFDAFFINGKWVEMELVDPQPTEVPSKDEQEEYVLSVVAELTHLGRLATECYINKVEVPKEWVDYNNHLKELLKKKDRSLTIMARPAIPANITMWY